MEILNFPGIGQFLPPIGIFNFLRFLGIFCPGIPHPRVVIDPPPDFVTEFTPKTADTARCGNKPNGRIFKFQGAEAYLALLIISRRCIPAKGRIPPKGRIPATG